MKVTHTEDSSRKMHPWLRVVRNGGRVVNATRADGSSRVACSEPAETKGLQVAPIYLQMAQQTTAVPRWTECAPRESTRLPKRPKLPESGLADNSYVNVYIEFFPDVRGEEKTLYANMERIKRQIQSAQAEGKVPAEAVTQGNVLCATVPISMLDSLCDDPAVGFIHPADPLALDRPRVESVQPDKKPAPKPIAKAAKHERWTGVLIGIIDVGGFDFSHPDFLDENGLTRFIAIWDQGSKFRKPPPGFTRGSEFRAKHLNAAIGHSKTPGLPPASWIERQSQLQPGSHGTHVASIAAGNSGLCPQAKIAAVLIDVPQIEDDIQRRRSTFSDSSAISHAVEYLLGIAKEENLPIVINISLGTNGGSHDGSSGVSRWLDAYLTSPGRAICIAAGNAGQEKAQNPEDLGWIMGRIHTSGQVPARGLEVELEWIVVGDGIEDWSENELEIWYSAQDRFSVSLKPPDAAEWIEVQPREFVENRRMKNGVTLSIYNELYHPTNGANYIAVYLSPNLDPENFRGIPRGIWKVRLRGEEVRDGRFNAWIERDDPMEIGRDGERRMFRFPSFFTEKTNVDSHSITSLACGHGVIAVANLEEATDRIHASSSQGPTRDDRYKPEIAAPGTAIVAANGFGDPEEPWIQMTGTSMASPYVAGVVGLMLGLNRDLTAAQCSGILQRTARPLIGSSYKWANDAGFGRIDAEAAIEEARLTNNRVELR